MTERRTERTPPLPATATTSPARGDATADADDAYFAPGDVEHATDVAAESLPSNTIPELNTPTTERPPLHPAAQGAQDHARVPQPNRRQSAIRLRRLRGPTLPSRLNPLNPNTEQEVEPVGGRRRSSSEPQRPAFPANTAWTALPPVAEVSSHRSRGDGPLPAVVPAPAPAAAQPVLARGGPGGERRYLPGRRRLTIQGHPMAQTQDADCYDSRIVDFLDVVDPEVATLSSITNIQNSLFVPSLGKWINRRPTYDLSQLPPIPGAFPQSKEDVTAKELVQGEQPPAGARSPSLSSVLSEPQYAILPNDASLEGWPEEDIKALNDYVRHMLHSRRSKIKQRLKAFGKYASRPLGFLVTLYATLITLFGLAWVLFLIGWIYVGDRQLYVINVIDYVLVALFAIVGDGLAPFRAVDTYHMIFVAHYHRKTWKMRKKLLLPELRDHNDLPTENGEGRPEQDLEAQNQQEKDEFYPVLSDKEQARLEHHQSKLAKSHTFYKPHETETHHAFPLRLLIAVVLLLDLHSCLQITLGGVTWGISYEARSTALTTTILCCSITVNIIAGVLISIGDRRTRKRDVLERLLKQDLTGEVMKKMRKKKKKEAQKEEAKRESEDGGGKTGMASLAASLSIPTRTDRSRRSGEKSRGAENLPSDQSEHDGNGNGRVEPEDAHMRIPGALPRAEDGV